MPGSAVRITSCWSGSVLVVFDRSVVLDDVPDGYRAMADRRALKVLVTL
ncbi:hypothetical protein [Kitasatospora sp. NPDC057015]